MRLLLALILSTAFLCAPCRADVKPISSPMETRLVVFSYDPDNSFTILTRPKSVTDIQFASDEHIKAVALGDTMQWEVAKTSDSQHMFIKPKFENIQTSATVITDKRSYQMMLVANADNGKWYQRVTFTYPDTALLREDSTALDDEKTRVAAATKESRDAVEAAGGISLEKINFNYAVEGDAPFKPTSVMDDGKFTYFRMPKLQELPAVFLITPDGDAELINYTIRGDYLVVQRLMDKSLLKIGKTEVSITRGKKGFLDRIFSND